MRTPETTACLTWISEAVAMPKIGQNVLLATPRQRGEFWDIRTAYLSAQHEGVIALPVSPGSRWPVDYSWRFHGSANDGIVMVTGNGWWALLDRIPLPPGAEHGSHNGFSFVRQVGDVFVKRVKA